MWSELLVILFFAISLPPQVHLNDVSEPQKVKLDKDYSENTEFSFILSLAINSVTQRKNSLIRKKKKGCSIFLEFTERT